MYNCPKPTPYKTSTSAAGFTLVELLIAVSIILIISAVTIPNFNSYISGQNLKEAQELVKNGIRDAQNRAITAVDSDDALCTATPTTICYWAIRFRNGTTNGTRYEIGKTTATTQDSCNNLTVEISSDTLPSNSYTETNAGNNACIFYRMYDGEGFSVNLFSNRLARVRLDSTTKCVEVNASGMVKEKDGCN